MRVPGNRAFAQEFVIGDDSFYVVDAMFDYSLHLIAAEIEWIEGFKQRLAALDDGG